jgi:hypothetical protein
MKTPRRYAPMGGNFAPVRVASFRWNGWQASAVYASFGSIFNANKQDNLLISNVFMQSV